MRFNVLGPLEALKDGAPVPLGGANQRALLGFLLLHVNEVTATADLVKALWGDAPPPTARKMVQNAVAGLRRVCAGVDSVGLHTTPPGYVLTARPEQLDLWHFRRLAEHGRTALRAQRWAAASRSLRAALALWRGPALADLTETVSCWPVLTRLHEERLAALEGCLEAELALGLHRELVGEMASLVEERPTSERLLRLFMLALYRCGRQSEALAAYRRTRSRLADEFGLDPSPELRELERQILNQHPDLASPVDRGHPGQPPHTPADPAFPAATDHPPGDPAAGSPPRGRERTPADGAASATDPAAPVGGVPAGARPVDAPPAPPAPEAEPSASRPDPATPSGRFPPPVDPAADRPAAEVPRRARLRAAAVRTYAGVVLVPARAPGERAEPGPAGARPRGAADQPTRCGPRRAPQGPGLLPAHGDDPQGAARAALTTRVRQTSPAGRPRVPRAPQGGTAAPAAYRDAPDAVPAEPPGPAPARCARPPHRTRPAGAVRGCGVALRRAAPASDRSGAGPGKDRATACDGPGTAPLPAPPDAVYRPPCPVAPEDPPGAGGGRPPGGSRRTPHGLPDPPLPSTGHGTRSGVGGAGPDGEHPDARPGSGRGAR